MSLWSERPTAADRRTTHELRAHVLRAIGAGSGDTEPVDALCRATRAVLGIVLAIPGVACCARAGVQDRGVRAGAGRERPDGGMCDSEATV